MPLPLACQELKLWPKSYLGLQKDLLCLMSNHQDVTAGGSTQFDQLNDASLLVGLEVGLDSGRGVVQVVGGEAEAGGAIMVLGRGVGHAGGGGSVIV